MDSFTFSDLLTWSDRLIEWQRDALRRVLRGGTDDEDLAELCMMAVAAQQPSNSEAVAPQPRMATPTDVPADKSSTVAVSLLALRDIQHANALSEGPLEFAPTGITVVYGDNGAGKSGFTRILKRACWARARGDSVLPNIEASAPPAQASATVVVEASGKSREIPWVDGGDVDPLCARITVFDSACATAQVAKPNVLAYTPELLQVFEDLATLLRSIADRLRSEKEAMRAGSVADILATLGLNEGTRAHKLLSSLSADTTRDEVREACSLDDKARSELKTLRNALSQNADARRVVLEKALQALRDVEGLVETIATTLGGRSHREGES